ncbi:MAG: ATP-grasp domain-containing protein [Planctomycetota bacterium]
MRLLIHEWCCSGGLSGPDVSCVVEPGADCSSLEREGRAMFRSLVADAVRDGGFEVIALVDAARPVDLPPAVRRIDVGASTEVERLVAAARDVDGTIVVAPETGGVLAARVAAVRAAGGRVLAPSDGFMSLAADKQATVDALAAAGVPVPAGRSLAAGEPWPDAFRLPAVRKARASTGCDGLQFIGPGEPPPRPAPLATRIEAWCAGTSVGVSCILGPRGVVPLATVRQVFTPGYGAYVGGSPLDDAGMRTRAERLALRSVEALARRDQSPSVGWVGVDIILGSRADGLDDRVLEVNPRVTTSFVGLAPAAPASLVRVIVAAAQGRAVDRRPFPSTCRFALTDDVPCPVP